jgi:hypothetical protein
MHTEHKIGNKQITFNIRSSDDSITIIADIEGVTLASTTFMMNGNISITEFDIKERSVEGYTRDQLIAGLKGLGRKMLLKLLTYGVENDLFTEETEITAPVRSTDEKVLKMLGFQTRDDLLYQVVGPLLNKLQSQIIEVNKTQLVDRRIPNDMMFAISDFLDADDMRNLSLTDKRNVLINKDMTDKLMQRKKNERKSIERLLVKYITDFIKNGTVDLSRNIVMFWFDDIDEYLEQFRINDESIVSEYNTFKNKDSFTEVADIFIFNYSLMKASLALVPELSFQFLLAVVKNDNIKPIVDGVYFHKELLLDVINTSDASNGDYDRKGDKVRVIVLGPSVKSIKPNAFRSFQFLESIIIPDSVSVIKTSAFKECSSLKSIIIPDSVGGIGDNCFADCKSLETINIPDSVSKINHSAFAGCQNLKRIVLPDSLTVLKNGLFNDCVKLETVVFPKSLELIGNNVFNGCANLKSIVIPDSVMSIGDYAFSYCKSLVSIVVGNSVTSIGESAFERCSSLTSIVIPESVTSIREGAFINCSRLTNVIIYDSVTRIMDYTFYGCNSLTSITIHESVTSIGDRAFENCKSLRSVVIPNSVTSIGDRAFMNCSMVTDITISYNDELVIGNFAFSYMNQLQDVRLIGGTRSQWEEKLNYEIFTGSKTLSKKARTYGIKSPKRIIEYVMDSQKL